MRLRRRVSLAPLWWYGGLSRQTGILAGERDAKTRTTESEFPIRRPGTYRKTLAAWRANRSDRKGCTLMVMLAPVLSPHGVLTLARALEADAAPALELACGVRLEQAFARGSGHGLLVLGADEVGTVLPPTLSFWRNFGARYVTALCSLP